ncbi:PASTA domain-containing protein [Acidaminobacter hydrogenoformans]|uniref:PASTA domain-containing protein n=1 Tax=Acidaminobacter hydrogenoformans DSM 2784 TaxID=1120920 RepID=A0A1G5S6D5_9FIRM|nr:PASTA domain-containing protein [Acidaminobacter hydrogenoformans]SCZ81129.1 PASTA domain-containing protein [Acidaminobacter hydrogenoformans DSM 2784]
MGLKTGLIKGGKIVAHKLAPDVVNLGAKIGTEIIEKQKSLVKIPNLKDVHIDEALRILKDELNLIPTSAVAKPNIAYANESENEVVYSEPRFGRRVNPKTMVKVYYLTQEVIDKSKELLDNSVQEFKMPVVVGLNIEEAREDLQGLGLRVTEKLEKPNLKFVNTVDGQVTRVTLPGDKKVISKLKTGDRICLYFVNEEVILESKAIRDHKEQEKQALIDKVGQVAQGVAKGIHTGAVEAPRHIAKGIKTPFKKKKVRDVKRKEK